MRTEESYMDKTGWGPGPWASEPDRIEWRYRGFPCLIVRNKFGALCGYVGLSPEHRHHGKHYDAIDCDVHGGLTFAATCDPTPGAKICHKPQPGEPGDVWWIGFDCNHTFDVAPGMDALRRDWSERLNLPALLLQNELYRNVVYVQAEVERLADQMVQP